MSVEQRQILEQVERVARELAMSLGLEIVEFVFRSQGQHSLLRIDIDRSGMPGVGLADCETFSRALGDRMEDLSFFDSSYELQISSPGIDRPIRSDDDLRRNTGRPVWMEFRNDKGTLVELRGTLTPAPLRDVVTIATSHGDVQVTRDRIVFMKQDVTLGRRQRKEP